MRRIDHHLSFEELTPGSRFEVRVGDRLVRVTVPVGARFGTSLRVGRGQETVLVRLVPPAEEAVCAPEEVELILAAEHIPDAFIEVLIESTRADRELAGVCQLRPPGPTELDGFDAGEDHTWVITGLSVSARGQKDSVSLGSPTHGLLDFHTHPGVTGGTAAFSAADRNAVNARGRPLAVVGTSMLSPDLVGLAALPFGSAGLVAVLGMKAVQQLERARADLEPRLLKVGVAARVLLPDGRVLPVQRVGAGAVRRAVDAAAFELDRATAGIADAAREGRKKLTDELQRRLLARALKKASEGMDPP